MRDWIGDALGGVALFVILGLVLVIAHGCSP